MANSPAFDTACSTLEAESDLDRLEARGTIRILMKQVGLEAGSVTPHELRTAIRKLLGPELESRGIQNGSDVVQQIDTALSSVTDENTADSPEDIFARLGGSTS